MIIQPPPRGTLPGAKLNTVTLEDVKGIPRNRLRQGVLNVDLTARPKPSHAGHQPPCSGPHYCHRSPSEPILLQFPVEVLKNVLGYLEPIWLFQVAAAYPAIHRILGFETSNRIWYKAIPPTLFLEPESFQDEVLVKDRMRFYAEGRRNDPSLELSKYRLIYDAFHYRLLDNSRFFVPAMLSLSELATSLDFNLDIGHPHDQRFYPTTPTRLRNMALGGPFQPWLDYRRELAGHLHHGMRCFICFDVAGRWQQYKRVWGMIWCSQCYEKYTLTAQQIAEIPSLVQLLRYSSHRSTICCVIKGSKSLYRPMVDELLRSVIGVDFATASCIQAYINQLLNARKGGSPCEPLKAHRRKLRLDIVSQGQKIWSRAFLKEDEKSENIGNLTLGSTNAVKRMIIHARQRWAPVTQLSRFLFSARLLSSTAKWAPDKPGTRWLRDPTLDLKTSHEVLQVGPKWINAAAETMIHDLVSRTGESAVTAWAKAAADWHIQRLRRDVLSGKYLNLDLGGKRCEGPPDEATVSKNRLQIIAKKLRIDPLYPVGTLTPHEKRMAVACFNKMLMARCAACPKHNLLIIPCGLERAVQHHRDNHSLDFYLNDQWTLRG